MDNSGGVGARGGVAARPAESAKSSRTGTIAVRAARAARTSVMGKERAAKEALMEFVQRRILHDQNRRWQQDSVGGGRRSRLALSRPAAGPACVSRGIYSGRVCWWSSCLCESARQGPQRKPTLSQHRKCAESV